MQMAFEHTASLKGISQEDVKKKKKSRNRKKGNAQSSDDATSQAAALGKESGQPKRSTDNYGGIVVQDSFSNPAPIQSVLTASGPSSSLSDSGWQMVAGPSHTNGWDDPPDGWETKTPILECRGNAQAEYISSDAVWETVAKVRGKGSVGRGRGRQEYSDWGQDRNPWYGSGGRAVSESSGRRYNGRGCLVGPKAQTGTNPRPTNGTHARQSAWGGPKANPWEGEYGQALSPDMVWPGVGGGSYVDSEHSCGSVPGTKNWPQGARASSERSSLSVDKSTGSGGNLSQHIENGKEGYDYPASVYSDSQCSDLDLENDSDEAFLSDDSNSQLTHEDQKKSKWFRDFFEALESMREVQVTEHDRQWHCPACKGGPGGIDWFRGLGPLATHARTMRSRRVKMHRSFADVLNEELRIRRTGGGGSGVSGTFGKWKGLQEDSEAELVMVVWPPIVVIQNTQLEQDEEEKWLGMGNKELHEMFRDYNPLKPRHAYGPQGHRGMSLLMFPDSPTGYYNAKRLEKHFIDARRSREDWNRPSKLMYHLGGNRILYGYMAVKEDMDIFNRHRKGKTSVKYEVRKLHEVVVEPMQLIDERNKDVEILHRKVEREKEVSKTLKNTVSVVARNLQLREKELQIHRQRAEEQHARNKQQQSDLEGFFQQESLQLAEEVSQKEAELQKLRDEFDRAHQHHWQKLEAQRSNIPNNQQQQASLEEEIAKETEKVEGSLREVQNFETNLVELDQKHHERRIEFQKQQHEAAQAFEQQLKAERAQLLEAMRSRFTIKIQSETSPELWVT